jgi:hypothetical protein
VKLLPYVKRNFSICYWQVPITELFSYIHMMYLKNQFPALLLVSVEITEPGNCNDHRAKTTWKWSTSEELWSSSLIFYCAYKWGLIWWQIWQTKKSTPIMILINTVQILTASLPCRHDSWQLKEWHKCLLFHLYHLCLSLFSPKVA